MTNIVFGGTLNLAQSVIHVYHMHHICE